MEKVAIKEIMSNFGGNSGAQLKYYILNSLYPDATAAEVRELGSFNAQSFSRIKQAVEGMELPLLKFDNQEEAADVSSEVTQLRAQLAKAENDVADCDVEIAMHIERDIEHLHKERALEEAIRQLEEKNAQLVEEVIQLKEEVIRLKKVTF